MKWITPVRILFPCWAMRLLEAISMGVLSPSLFGQLIGRLNPPLIEKEYDTIKKIINTLLFKQNGIRSTH